MLDLVFVHLFVLLAGWRLCMLAAIPFVPIDWFIQRYTLVSYYLHIYVSYCVHLFYLHDAVLLFAEW